MTRERFARFIVILAAVGLPVGLLTTGSLLRDGEAIEMRARMPEAGGWQPGELVTRVGEPLRLRLTSDDVVHGFAVGKIDMEAIDVKPGEMVETTLNFDEPGRYVYYCTRWCGPDHWRMRGIIEVSGPDDATAASPAPPLFMRIGLDIDAPHSARQIPEERPSAERGARLGLALPANYLDGDAQSRRSPDAVWEELRSDSLTRGMSDMEVWDLVAWLWTPSMPSEMVSEGERLYRANCAACHGEGGAGDGVMAASLSPVSPDRASLTIGVQADSMAGFGHRTSSPADLTDPRTMLGASSALLEGKIIRGGMGTGMPYWGPILTDREIRALVEYLWTFQLDIAENPDPDEGS